MTVAERYTWAAQYRTGPRVTEADARAAGRCLADLPAPALLLAVRADRPEIAVACIEPHPDEEPVFFRRRRVLVPTGGAASPLGTWTVLGARPRDGSGPGRYIFLGPGGERLDSDTIFPALPGGSAR